MKKKVWTPAIIGLSLSISLILTIIGEYISPIFFDTGTKGENAPNPLIGLVITVAAIIIGLILISLLFVRMNGNVKLPVYLKGFPLLLLIGIIAMLAVSMINGLLAVLIQALLKNTMTIDQIKGVIDIVAGIISLLSLPIFIKVLLTFAFEEQKVFKCITTGIKSIKKHYLKILILLMVLSAAGYLVSLPLGYVDMTVILRAVKSLLFALIGTSGILVMLSIYDYEYDTAGNLVKYIDAMGKEVRYVYDSKSLMTEWYDQEDNRVVKNTYDGEGRVTNQLNAKNQAVTLQYSANQTITTDANGNATTYIYDDNYRTTKIIHPDGEVVDKAYGANNTLASDDLYTYTYDGKGNKTSEKRADGKIRT